MRLGVVAEFVQKELEVGFTTLVLMVSFMGDTEMENPFLKISLDHTKHGSIIVKLNGKKSKNLIIKYHEK